MAHTRIHRLREKLRRRRDSQNQKRRDRQRAERQQQSRVQRAKQTIQSKRQQLDASTRVSRGLDNALDQLAENTSGGQPKALDIDGDGDIDFLGYPTTDPTGFDEGVQDVTVPGEVTDDRFDVGLGDGLGPDPTDLTVDFPGEFEEPAWNEDVAVDISSKRRSPGEIDF